MPALVGKKVKCVWIQWAKCYLLWSFKFLKPAWNKWQS